MTTPKGSESLREGRTGRTLPESRSSFIRHLIRKRSRSSLNPLTHEGEPGYIPTVQVIALVRGNFHPAYVRRQIMRNLTQFTDCDELDQAVAVEIACRELLASQQWLYSDSV